MTARLSCGAAAACSALTSPRTDPTPRSAAARAPRRAGRAAATVVRAAAKQVAVAVPPPGPQDPEAAMQIHTPTVVAVAAALAAAAGYAWRLSRRASKQQVVEYPGISGLVRPNQIAARSELDPGYKVALAHARQATAIHRAIGFLNTGSRARAHVEVRRALHENSICRSPVLAAAHDKGERLELYRLHLQQSDMPTDFGTLLQLRAMLDLDFDDAEEIERQMAQQSTFSI